MSLAMTVTKHLYFSVAVWVQMLKVGVRNYMTQCSKCTEMWAGATQQREVCACVDCIATFKCMISVWAEQAVGTYPPSEDENTNEQKLSNVSSLSKVL